MRRMGPHLVTECLSAQKVQSLGLIVVPFGDAVAAMRSIQMAWLWNLNNVAGRPSESGEQGGPGTTAIERLMQGGAMNHIGT